MRLRALSIAFLCLLAIVAVSGSAVINLAFEGLSLSIFARNLLSASPTICLIMPAGDPIPGGGGWPT